VTNKEQYHSTLFNDNLLFNSTLRSCYDRWYDVCTVTKTKVCGTHMKQAGRRIGSHAAKL